MWGNCDNIKGQQDFEDPPGRGEPKDNPNDIQASPTLHSGQGLWKVELKRLYALGAAREVQWLKVLLLKVRKMLFKPIYSPEILYHKGRSTITVCRYGLLSKMLNHYGLSKGEVQAGYFPDQH